MTQTTLSVSGGLHDRERNLDWLTALFPVLVMAVIYYRWQAVVLLLLAAAGYAAVSVGLQCLSLLSCRVVPAAVTGVLVMAFLPAGAPLWVAAIAGGVAAVVAALPNLLDRFFSGKAIARPFLQPALVGVLLVVWAFPELQNLYAVPVQWATADGAVTALSLQGLFQPAQALDLWRLFFGVYPGGVGETCSPALLLAAGYLLLRRRLRLIPYVCMLGTVALLSQIFWQAPLYSLLAGSTLLCALLVGDRTATPDGYVCQALVGVLAGVGVVVLRLTTHTDGGVLAVLAAGILGMLLPLLGRLLSWLWKKIFAKNPEIQK